MKKLSNYVKNGRGHGIILVVLFTLLLSLVFSVPAYLSIKNELNQPENSAFFDSLPTFQIRNGVAQDKNVNWIQQMLFQDTVVTLAIDTSIEEISLPTSDGVYLTQKWLYFVGQKGERTSKYGLWDIDFSPDFVKSVILTMPIIEGIIAILGAILIYLIIVFATMFITWALRINRFGAGLWRLCSLTWMALLLLSYALVFVTFEVNFWYLVLGTIILNAIILSRLEK